MLFAIPEFSPNVIIAFFFLPFCFTAFTIQFSSLLQQRSSTEVIYGKQEPGQKGYRTLLTLSVALAPLRKLACQSPSNVCIACATGHTSCVSPVQTLSDMQQILPEQQPKKKKKWRVAAFSSDKCRDVMCHGGSAGNSTTWITKIYISSQNRALIDARGDARCSPDMTKLSGYVMRRRQSVNTRVRM